MSLLGHCVVFLLILWLSASAVAGPILTPRRVRCRNIGHSWCFKHWFLCPIACPHNCLMDCVSCRPVCRCNYPGAICEDPRFVGGDGITFYFHGRKDEDFCLVSDTNLHINAHFIGKRNPNLKRDFTWVQSIGIIFNTHKLLVAAKRTSTWSDTTDRLSISFDAMPITVPANEGSRWRSPTTPSLTILRTSHTNHVMLEVAHIFRINAAVVPVTAQESRVHGYNISDEDCFAHLELGFKFYRLTDMVDGILGQTYSTNYVSKTKVNVPMPVMGGYHKFSSSGIFATDCPASRFGSTALLPTHSNAKHYPYLKCDSGMKGNGVICKR